MSTNSKTDPDTLLTDKRAAALLGIHRATFWRWVQAGHMPAPIRICGTTRWRRRDVLAAVERAEGEAW